MPMAVAIHAPDSNNAVAAHLEVTGILNGSLLEVKISAKACHLSSKTDPAALGWVIDIVAGIRHMLEGYGTGSAEVVLLPCLIMIAPMDAAIRICPDHVTVILMPYICVLAVPKGEVIGRILADRASKGDFSPGIPAHIAFFLITASIII